VPIEDENGDVGGVLVVCNDVTAQHIARDALQDQTEHLRQLFDQAPSFMAVLRGPDHVFEIANATYRNLIGDRDFIGKKVRDALPEIEGQGFFELLDDVYRSGQPHVGKRTPLVMRLGVDGPTKQAFVDFVYAPIFNKRNEVSGIFVEGIDVTEHINNEDHLRLINEELQHRVKNTLTVISAIASQTFQGARKDKTVMTFQARLAAFAKAHDSLTVDRWGTATISDVIKGALAPHRTGEGRFSISGPPILLGSKQAVSLALALHELGTNAIKYGALSDNQGRVNISWDEEYADSSSTFRFLWEEKDGPSVATPSRTGFGSRLIKRILTNDLGGEVEVLYGTAGVTCRITAPMRNLGGRELN
jgi:two-component sensor histidine kinase